MTTGVLMGYWTLNGPLDLEYVLTVMLNNLFNLLFSCDTPKPEEEPCVAPKLDFSPTEIGPIENYTDILGPIHYRVLHH